MDLDADVLRARHRQERERRTLVRQDRVRRVLHDDDVVRAREVDDLLVEVHRGDAAGRAVRVVQHEQLRAPADVGGDAVEVGEVVVLRKERQAMDVAAVVLRVRAGDRVTGDRHERHVTRVDEAGRDHGERGLRADAVVHLGRGIERHAEEALHEARGGFLEGGDPVVGIAAVLGLRDLLGHAAADRLGRHRVVLADAEVDERALGVVGECLALGALDLLELVDVGALAVLRPADALGEERLEVGIAHDRESYDAACSEATLRREGAGRIDEP